MYVNTGIETRPICHLTRSVGAEKQHRIHRQTAGRRWGQEEQRDQHCLHHWSVTLPHTHRWGLCSTNDISYITIAQTIGRFHTCLDEPGMFYHLVQLLRATVQIRIENELWTQQIKLSHNSYCGNVLHKNRCLILWVNRAHYLSHLETKECLFILKS